MRKTAINESKTGEEAKSAASDRFEIKARLNLNELLKRRTEERKVDKKTNILIFSGTVAVAAVAVLILNL